MKVLIRDKSVNLSPDQIIGSGGEAEIYEISKTRALKLFKPPEHPIFSNSPSDQKSASLKIKEHQTKLKKLPSGFSPFVITPIDFAFDQKKQIIGYTMDMVKDAEVLLRYSNKSFRQGFVSDKQVIEIFKNLFFIVKSVHKAGVVIGDFNDLNVLVKKDKPYLIDFDSVQFGNYFCNVFTNKFVDPLICDKKSKSTKLVKPHNQLSDWYAYLIMLMQTLIYVGPYGGVYRPKDKKDRVPERVRPLKRITLFSDDVIYPKPAKPLSTLPDSFLQYLQEVFKEDKREEFPISIMDRFKFDEQGNLLSVIAEKTAPIREKEVILGKVSAKKIFSTSGKILYATVQDGKLRYIYHSQGSYFREGDNSFVKGDLDPYIRFRINGEKTLVGKNDKVVILGKNETQTIDTETYGRLPILGANSKNSFFIRNGSLIKVSDMGPSYPETVGQVLTNRTLFWVGDSLGFGFYFGGGLSVFFLFNTDYRGINDSISIPSIKGQLIDATCFFSKNRVCFLTSIKQNGEVINSAYFIDSKGQVIASSQSNQNSGDWLSNIRGKCFIGNMLFSSSDEGIVRIEAQNSDLVETKQFRDTARFVDSHSFLLPGSSGLIAIKSNQDIWNIQMK